MMTSPLKRPSCVSLVNFTKKNKLLFATILGIILGIALGFALRPYGESYEVKAWVKIWGEIFFRMLKIIILPLIVSCIVVGVTSLDTTASGKVGSLTILYIVVTQIQAIVLGIVVALIIRPGNSLADGVEVPGNSTLISYTDMFTDFLRNLFPDNIIRTTLQSTYTSLDVQGVSTGNSTREQVVHKQMIRDSMNTMGVVVTTLGVALAINKGKEKAEPLLNVIKALYNIVFTILNAVLWFSPVGVASLIAGTLMSVDDIGDIWQSLGLYVLSVLVGHIIHSFILLPLLLFIFVRQNPYRYYIHLFEGLFVALSTTSSATAMPHMLKANVEQLGVNPSIANFVMPIEIVMNRDGSAMFIMIAITFLAQSYGISLSFGQYALTGLLTLLLSAAVANVPSGSIMVLMMVASSVNIPIDDRLGLLMSVEWLVDRIRTCSNALGNGFGCSIIESWCNIDMQTCKHCICLRRPGRKTRDYDIEAEVCAEKISLKNAPKDAVDVGGNGDVNSV